MAAPWIAPAARKRGPAAPVDSMIKPKATGAKAKAPWPMATIVGTTRDTSSLTNSTCAMSGGSEVALPIPNPNRTMPSKSSGTVLPAASRKVSDPPI